MANLPNMTEPAVPPQAEPADNLGLSISNRVITGFTTANFMTKDINLWVAGRKHKLEPTFTDAADRDRALAILNKHAL